MSKSNKNKYRKNENASFICDSDKYVFSSRKILSLQCSSKTKFFSSSQESGVSVIVHLVRRSDHVVKTLVRLELSAHTNCTAGS